MANIRLLISFIFFVAFISRRCVCMSGEIDYQLLDDFDVFLDGVNSVKFEVRACNDVQLLLMKNSSNFDVQSYEIIIGGWNNRKSAICKERTDKCVLSADHQASDCNNLRAFWISWDTNTIRVGKGSAIANRQFMIFNDHMSFELKHIAVSSGYWIFENHKCGCCTRKLEFHYCQELLRTGVKQSGVYNVTSGVSDNVFEVYCDMETDDGGWLVFQNRQDGSENFKRDWDDYEKGFGDLEGEFWLGNRILSMIVSKGHFELRIDLEDWDGDKRFAKYRTFLLGNGFDNYRLTVYGYIGDAGDALTDGHSGCQFTTRDRDNDKHDNSNCALTFKGGWWFSNCLKANLNGIYRRGQHESYADGVNWKPWKGLHYSLKKTRMMIREIR